MLAGRLSSAENHLYRCCAPSIVVSVKHENSEKEIEPYNYLS
jgi:hypothetical protein